MLDDLKVSVFNDDLEVVVDAAFAINGEDGADGIGVIPGGLTGQLLGKKSEVDFDLEWKNPTAGLPVDGTTGQVLTKVSDAPLDTAWQTPVGNMPIGGIAGQLLAKATSLDYDAIWQTPDYAPTIHTHVAADITNLTATLDPRYAALVHTHTAADITNLTATLDPRYAALVHTHTTADITDLAASLSTKQPLDATLTALAAMTGTGLVERTGTDIYTHRALGVAAATSVPTRADADARYALLSGATFTGVVTVPSLTANAGNITINRAGDATSAALILDSDAGQVSAIHLRTGVLIRWYFGKLNNAEGSANAGSDFFINAYADDGTTPVGNALTIARATRIVAFGVSPTAPTPTAGDSTTKLATTAFVAAAVTAGGGGQPLDATLTALAALDATAGLLEQTGADAFVKRALGVAAATSVPTRNDADLRYAQLAAANTFTVTPSAPTVTYPDNTTKLATTAYVSTAVSTASTAAQPVDPTLTALAALDATAGLLEQTGADAFTKRALGVAADTSVPTRADADARYALLSGATFTGAVTVPSLTANAGSILIDRTGDAATAALDLRADVGQADAIYLRTAALLRWQIAKTTTAESTGNVGSNFAIVAYDDAGASLGNAFTINRATRIADFPVSPTAPTPTAGDSTTKLATTAFVATAVTTAAQPVDPTLTALAALDATAGLLEQTGADAFTKRALGVAAATSVPTRADADARYVQLAGDHTWSAGAGNNVFTATTPQVEGALAAYMGTGGATDYIFAVYRDPVTNDTNRVFGVKRDSSASAVLIHNNVVWHAGNFTPANYAQLAAVNTFTEPQTIDVTTVGTALSIYSSNDTATTGPTLVLRRTSPSPAVSDNIGMIAFQGHDSALAATSYADIYAQILDPINATRTASLYIRTYNVGTFSTQLTIGNGIYVGAATGSFKGVGTLNATALYEQGVALDAKYAQLAVAAFSGTVSINTTTSTSLIVNFTDDTAVTGPTLVLRRTSTTPAANDFIGSILWQGYDSTAVVTSYADILGQIVDPTNGAETGRLYIRTYQTGVFTNVALFGPGIVVGAATGFDKGAGTLNATILHEQGVALASKYAQLAAINTFTTAQVISTTAASIVQLALVSTDPDILMGPILDLRRDSASPAALDAIGAIRFYGRDTAAVSTQYASVEAHAMNVTDGATEAGRLKITTRTAGATTDCVYFAGGIFMPTAAGGDKGPSTINASAVYDDNVLLTCLPMQREFLQEGKVDLGKWDALSPTNYHPTAHKFADLVNSGFDPRSPAAYIARALEDEALPGMPTFKEWHHGEISTGEMITRLWLAIEMLATAWMTAYNTTQEKPI